MSAATDTDERYTIISADCHAGGSHAAYREYLDPEFHEDFDAWRGRYKNPYNSLSALLVGHIARWRDGQWIELR